MSDHSHRELHFLQSAVLRDLVIGVSDGLTVPFALAAGLAGAVATNHLILTAGLAEVVAGSIAMGLGGYLSGQSEIEHYASELKREYREIELIPEAEKEEVREIFAQFGLDQKSQNTAVEALAQNKDKWARFMMRFELGLEKPDESRALLSALRIGGGYCVGGIIPLVPYFVLSRPNTGLLASAVVTVICLLLFGYFKSKACGQSASRGALKTAFIGGLAAAAAYLITSFANNFLQ